MMKKMLSLSFVLMFGASSILAGCSKSSGTPKDNADKPAAQNDQSAKEKYTFKIFMPGTNPTEIEAYKKLEENANVHINWDIPSWAQLDEKKNLMFASGDYADAIAGWAIKPEEVMKYGPKGVFIPLEDLIDKYSVNIKRMLQEVPEARKAITTPNGHIYTLPLVQKQANTKAVLHINKQWLDKLGLAEPKTTDELYQVLKAFKEKDPNGNGKKDEIPLTFLFNGPNNNQLGFFGFFGRIDTYDHLVTENGKVLFTAAYPEWKDAVKYLNKLWKEGLIDQEAFTHDTQQWQSKGRQSPPVYGVTSDWDGVESLGKDNFKQYELLLPVKGPGVQQAVWPEPDPNIFRTQFVITSAAKHPERIIQWIDQLFPAITKDGLNETLYGPKGEGWTVTPEGKFKALEVKDSGKRYVKLGGFPNYWPFDLSDKTEGVYMGPSDVDGENYKLYTIGKAYTPYITKNPFPPVWLTPEQQKDVSTIQTDIKKATDQNMVRWITGEGDIDAEWDKFQKDLKNMGVDKLVSIYQQAVDAYNKK